MGKSPQGTTALRLMEHYAHERELGQCHCLKLPEDSPEFQELTERLAYKVEFDVLFIRQFLSALKAGNREFYAVTFSSMCQDLAMRMFCVFIESREYDTYDEIVESILSDSGLPVPRHDVEVLVTSTMNSVAQTRLRAPCFAQVN